MRPLILYNKEWFIIFILILIIITGGIYIIGFNESKQIVSDILEQYSGIPERTVTLYDNNGKEILSITDKMVYDGDGSKPWYIIRNKHSIKFFGGIVVDEEFGDENKPIIQRRPGIDIK